MILFLKNVFSNLLVRFVCKKIRNRKFSNLEKLENLWRVVFEKKKRFHPLKRHLPSAKLKGGKYAGGSRLSCCCFSTSWIGALCFAFLWREDFLCCLKYQKEYLRQRRFLCRLLIENLISAQILKILEFSSHPELLFFTWALNWKPTC